MRKHPLSTVTKGEAVAASNEALGGLTLLLSGWVALADDFLLWSQVPPEYVSGVAVESGRGQNV